MWFIQHHSPCLMNIWNHVLLLYMQRIQVREYLSWMWMSWQLSITFVRYLTETQQSLSFTCVQCLQNKIACTFIYQAYWNRRYYPGYAWIIIDNFAEWEWWKIGSREGSEAVNCTQSQFETVLNYSVTVTPLPADPEEENAKSMKVAYISSLK